MKFKEVYYTKSI